MSTTRNKQTRTPRSQRGPQNSVPVNTYEGGAFTRRTMGWHAPTTTANSGVLGNLTTLRARSRAATRNNGIAAEIIDKHVTNLIGTGIKPMSKATGDLMVEHPLTGERVPFRVAQQYLWTVWTDSSDADGLLDFYGQQTLLARGWLEGGEMFARARPRLAKDGLPVPLQIQLLEPELCPHTYNMYAPESGNRIRAGIEFNPIGKRIAYWFHPTRPELDDFNQAEMRRVPAESARHIFDVSRAGQLRGLPHLTRALLPLYELDKTNDAHVLRDQLGNLFVAFLKRPKDSADQNDLDPLTNMPRRTVGTRQALTLEPGIFQELEPGEELEWSDPPAPTVGFVDFMKFQLRMSAIAGRIPYEILTGDLSGLNDRSVRVSLNEFRRHLMAWQHQVIGFQFCQWVWDQWNDALFLSGALPIPADYADPARRLRYTAVKWVPQGWPYLHPVQDIEASEGAIRAGLSSRSAEVSERGEDSEVIDAENAADNKRADDLKLKYDSDGRNTINGKMTTPAPAPAPGAQD